MKTSEKLFFVILLRYVSFFVIIFSSNSMFLENIEQVSPTFYVKSETSDINAVALSLRQLNKLFWFPCYLEEAKINERKYDKQFCLRSNSETAIYLAVTVCFWVLEVVHSLDSLVSLLFLNKFLW